jgi:uncharacterized OB-fold protein
MGAVAGKFPVVPVASPWSEGFWAALRDHQLAIQSCASCGRLEHPPTVCCPACGSFERAWPPVSGLGTVYSYIICHHSTHPALNGLVPYNVALIDLDEGVRIVSSIVSDDDDDTRALKGAIGKRVRVQYVDGSDCVLPVFRLIE